MSPWSPHIIRVSMNSLFRHHQYTHTTQQISHFLYTQWLPGTSSPAPVELPCSVIATITDFTAALLQLAPRVIYTNSEYIQSIALLPPSHGPLVARSIARVSCLNTFNLIYSYPAVEIKLTRDIQVSCSFMTSRPQSDQCKLR